MDAAAAWVLRRLDELRAIAILPLAWVSRLSDQGEVIDADVAQWLAVLGRADGTHGLHSLLYAFPEFRSVYYYRLEHGNARGRLAARLAKRWYRPVEGLAITAPEIGAGLFVAHGQATCIAAAKIGRNCYVHQNVTIGWDYRSERAPILGDGVFVGTGAVVLGAITIGDLARIGANAVVLCDVPAGATAVGAPAKVLERAVQGDHEHDEDDEDRHEHGGEQPTLPDLEAGEGRAGLRPPVEGGGPLLVGQTAGRRRQ